MRTPPCLDEELLLRVRSARIIVYRGRKIEDEEKLLVSQVSVTQKIFGLTASIILYLSSLLATPGCQFIQSDFYIAS